ncbi:MAG TPA: hypothetical protein PLS49_09485, partial [Candidatus Woesebacteria bacterium]|nr:hypothetical protein [Candidatus Woesebacteria bacterium]
ISALAVSDCVDGTRDLCTGDGCLGADVAAVDSTLASWALSTGGKSALPYYFGSVGTNDFQSACEQNSGNDYPLACYDGLFYKNTKTCGDGDTNYLWAASAGYATRARLLGYNSCSYGSYYYTSNTVSGLGFRVVVRP